MEYRAIEEGIQFSRARKATSYKGAIIAAVCVVAAGAFFLSGSGNSELALAQTRTAGVSCRNVRTAAQMDRRAVFLSFLFLHIQTCFCEGKRYG